MNDFKFACRQLLKFPGFTLIAVLSLGLGLGACTAVFSIVNGVLLRSLPVPNPQQLRILQWTGTDARLRSFSGESTQVGSRLTGNAVSPPVFMELREHGASFADIFAFAPLEDVTLLAAGSASAARGMIVSDNFFSALGAVPYLGTVFAPGIHSSEAAQQVILTSDAWGKYFARDPGIINQVIRLNGITMTVIGVLPSAFSGVRAGNSLDFYLLMTPQSQFLERAATSTDHWWVRLMARLKPGAKDAQLAAALDVVFPRQIES
ncbi:MAG: efflux pump, inner rane subunit, partial [Verrucomicrobiales bacterium]|nr:efflux pump, inner rane subunit [Verrucomicrobiales bacterium]